MDGWLSWSAATSAGTSAQLASKKINAMARKRWSRPCTGKPRFCSSSRQRPCTRPLPTVAEAHCSCWWKRGGLLGRWWVTDAPNRRELPMTSTTNSTTGSGQLSDSVRAEAGAVQETTADATREVAGTAKEQVGVVAADVRDETRRLFGETRDQVTQQAGQQRDNVVGGLRSLGDELRSMAEHGSGWGAQAARHGASWSDQAAGFLDGRELSDVLEDLRMMARRRPGRFLAGAV